MKKYLRMFSMALVAIATSLVGYAQEPQNCTWKVWNADFEKGVHGWDIVADQHNWYQGVKGDAKAPGYYGFNNLCLENWKGAGSGLTDNEASQTIKGLPNGVYVFGAYMLATNDSWVENREEIEGVVMFANEQEVVVGTNRTEGVGEIWGHTAKFNVAVRVTDGTLKVGVKCESTNASFVCMDNATLYYFGENVEFSDALDAMAKIDMNRSIAIADTCAALKINLDTLAYLNEKIAAAKALTKAEDAYDMDEQLWWGMRLARKSAVDYSNLAKAIAAAKESSAKEWTDYPSTVAALEALNALIAQSEAKYEELKSNRDEIDELMLTLDEATALLADALLDGVLQRVTRQILIIVVGKVLQLQLVRRTDEAVGECGGNDGVCKLPDLTLRILECAVAVNHDLNVLAGCLEDACLHVVNQIGALSGEKLDLILGRFVRAEQTVSLVASASVYGCVENIVQAANHLCTCRAENALGALTGVNVAGEDAIGIVQDRFCLICKHDLNLSAAGADEVGVVFHVVNTGELQLGVIAEELTVALQRKNVAIRIHACRIDLIERDHRVSNLVGGIAEHKHNLLCALGNAAQADRKTVTREDREQNTDGAAAELVSHVLGDRINRCIVTLCTCNDRLSHRNNVAVTQLKALCLCCLQHTVGHDCGKIIALADDGATDTARDRTNSAFFVVHLFIKPFL